MLGRAFVREGAEVVELSRKPGRARGWRVVGWDGRSVGGWAEEIDGADVVINLAGRSVNCRYNAENRKEIMESRVDSVRVVGEAIARAKRRPKVWLQASTATIYAHRYDGANDEEMGIIGGNEAGAPETWRFSIEVAKAWEGAVKDVGELAGTRTVLMRSALTLSPDPGGVFSVLLGLVRAGLGGTAGNGRQYVSWVHEADFLGAVRWIIEHEELTGVVNIASPEPVPNAEFMRVLREAWGMPVGLPAMEWMLEIGAAVMGTETELILKSRRVAPGRLLGSGFEFRYAGWGDAAQELCGRLREGRTADGR
jgi:uncharacterized protein (TIGR01777 family)